LPFRFFTLLLALVTLMGCAVQSRVLKPGSLSAPPVPPTLTDDQILGFKKPPGLIQDNETSQFAMKEVMEAYWKLRDRAAQDGWHLILVSGYRSFYAQRQIWNYYDMIYLKDSKLTAKFRVRRIMSLVSVPGLSRHHWGTDLDISEQNLRGRLLVARSDRTPKIVDFYHWMEQNAPRFGFCKVYLGKKGAVRDEPWHWSYFAFAATYQNQLMRIQDFRKILNDKVGDVDFLTNNFPEIFKKETQSINSECSIERTP
jgi:LAS superfamily LD-carboxypeptidase LdcB